MIDLGPGTYATSKQPKVDNRESNNFSTKIARFCPTAPGSTPFHPPSNVTNPGPGTYVKEKDWTEPTNMEKIQEKYASKKHKDQVNKPKGRAPSIPSRKMAPHAFTGNGKDTVGPSTYTARMDTIK